MIGKEWNYYFERYFELFRVKMENKEVIIQNLLKEITVLDSTSAQISFEWKDIVRITNLYVVKSIDPFLSLTGADWENGLFVKFLLKGGELVLYKADIEKKLLPLLRVSLTSVEDYLRQDNFKANIDKENIHSLVFDGSIVDYIVGFNSDKTYQFATPNVIRDFNSLRFPFQLRQRSYYDLINKYSTSAVRFTYSNTVDGFLTHNGKTLTYKAPKL